MADLLTNTLGWSPAKLALTSMLRRELHRLEGCASFIPFHSRPDQGKFLRQLALKGTAQELTM